MNSTRDILEKLLDGIDPVTGEVLPDGHVCTHPAVIRALHHAINALEKTETAEPAEDTAEPVPSNEEATPASSLEVVETEESPLPAPDDSLIRTSSGRLKSSRPWTKDEEKLLRHLFRQGYSSEQIAKALHRRERGVLRELMRLGLVPKYASLPKKFKNRGSIWTVPEDDELTSLFDLHLSLEEMAEHFGRSPKAIEYRLVHLGLIDRLHTYVPGTWVWTQSEKTELETMFRQGISIPFLAARFRCSEAAIKARLFYMGLCKEAPSILPKKDE